MLPEHLKELLTASVDGELSAAERRIVERLLRTSEAARVFHAQLMRDVDRLRRLPVLVPEFDFAGAVVDAITERSITPTPLPTRRKRHSWNSSMKPSWLPMALAASVTLVLSLGSYFYFAANQRIVSQSENPTAPPKVDEQASSAQPKPERKPNLPSTETLAVTQPEVGPIPREIPERVALERTPETLPNPRTVEDVNTAPSLPVGPSLEIVEKIRLPLILPLRDLDQGYPREKFREDVKKDDVIRVDLFARDTAKATEMLHALLKNRGHHVITESLVAEHFKKKQATEVLFFTESFTPEEFAQLFEQLGVDDKKSETKKAGDGIFGKFVLSPFQSGDLDKLARLLGVTVGHLKMPKPKPVGIDLRKPLEENTANALAQSFPKNRSVDKLTMVLSYSPINTAPQHSKEIKSFLEKRGDRKAGTVPVLLVMRIMN